MKNSIVHRGNENIVNREFDRNKHKKVKNTPVNPENLKIENVKIKTE